MCGRFVTTRSEDQLAADFGVQDVEGPEVGPSWNVAPTQDVRIVLDHAASTAENTDDRDSDDAAGGVDGDNAAAGPVVRRLRTAHWGLVPFWSRDPTSGARMINARLETVTTKPAFRAAARRRRALVPGDGYYEWTRIPGQKAKQPYFLHDDTGQALAFGAVYELWRNPDAAEGAPQRWLLSVAIITHTAADAIGHVHDRMPLIIPPERRDAWLNPNTREPDDVRDLLEGIHEPTLTPRPVSTAVNNVRNNRPELVETVPDPAHEPS